MKKTELFILVSALAGLGAALGLVAGATSVVVVFAAVLALRFALEWRFVASPARKRSDVHVSPWSLALLGGSYAVSAGAVLFALVYSGIQFSASYWIGLSIVCAGYAARLWCISVLGTSYSFSLHPRSQILVVHGPYWYVRHPVYTAHLAELGGMFIIAPTAWTGVSFVVAYIVSEYRSRREETALAATFGGAFTEYCFTRKRFIPFIY
jgi:protein-S-isoprenylcysteine O-methyltransferase Ste14